MMRAVPPAPQPRRIWLCADDYGIAPGVNTAIRDLDRARAASMPPR